MGQPLSDAVNSITGAGATADAQQNIANQQLAQQRADRQAALSYTPEELQQQQQAITLNSQDIARKQQLLASADPALIEAGKQATQLLQGKSAASLAPIQNQRAQQRAQLEQTLSQQLGSDYATSSAGIQALNNFDQQTSNLLTNAQQSSLGTLLGVAQNVSGNIGNQQQNINNSSGFFNNMVGQRQNAIFGSKIDGGLNGVGQLYRATSAQQTLGKVLGAGASYAIGSSLGGGTNPSSGNAPVSNDALGNYGGDANQLFGLNGFGN